MSDENKTRKQLLEDLIVARQRIAELEQQADNTTAETPLSHQRTEALLKAVQAILGATEVSEICRNLITHFNDLVNADRTTLYLVDHDRRTILLNLAYGRVENDIPMSYDELEMGISGQVFKSGQPVLSLDAADEPEGTYNRRLRDDVGSLIVVPLMTKVTDNTPTVLGTITTLKRREQANFTQHDMDLLMILVNQAAAVIENAQLYESVKEQYEYNRGLLDAIPELLFHLDDNGIFIDYRAESTQDLAIPPEHFIGQHFRDVLPPHLSHQLSQAIKDAAQSGQVQSLEYEMDLPDKRKQIFEARISTTRKGSSVIISRNITERKRTEDVLRRSEAQLRSLANALPDVTIIFDHNGTHLDVLGLHDELLLTSAQNLKGRTFHEIFPPDLAQKFEDFIRKTLASQQMESLEYTLDVPAGTRWFEGRGAPMPSIEGEQDLVVFVSRDITERKRSEEVLRRSEAQLRALANALPDVTLIVDGNGTIQNVLASRDDLPFLTTDPITNQMLTTLTSQTWAKPLLEVIQKTFATQTMQSIEYEVELQSRHYWFDVRSAIMPAIEEDNEWVILAIRDITNRKQTEIKLSQSEEIITLKDRIISTVSHEFRTPLAMIQIAGDLFIQYGDKLTEERKQELFQQVRQQVSVLAQLIDDMLSISSAQSGDIEFQPIKQELVSFCHMILDEAQFSDTETHQFELVSSEDTIIANVDNNLLKPVLEKLLSNAIKFSPSESRISLTLTRDNKHIDIKISDEGIGIPAKEQAQLFEPFHRASNVGTTRGTGLSLAIAKRYVELHGGHITLESDTGKGSTFTVSLPVG